MHPELQPAVFGICKGMETVSCERARAATLRIHAQGGRQLVMASSWALKDFMEKNGITQLGPDNLRDFFKGMSKETIDAFIGAGHKLYHTTVMPAVTRAPAIIAPRLNFENRQAERMALEVALPETHAALTALERPCREGEGIEPIDVP